MEDYVLPEMQDISSGSLVDLLLVFSLSKLQLEKYWGQFQCRF
jgi:hypothetical protein